MFHHKALVFILYFSVNTVDNEVIHQAGIPLKGTLTMTDYEISVHWVTLISNTKVIPVKEFLTNKYYILSLKSEKPIEFSCYHWAGHELYPTFLRPRLF